MALEIERKFLVTNDGWKSSFVRSVRIRDGLIANNKGHKARVRIANDVATIALKSRRSGLARTEVEYVIPYSDAEEMLRTMCDGNVLDKVRHFVSHVSNTWQVDVYEGLLVGIVLAEIELTDAGQTLTLPDWIGAEVTTDPRYRKINTLKPTLANPAERFTCEDARKIATPTLLVGGDISPQIFPLMLNGLQPCLAHVERVTITKASHGVYQDNPADFNREVLGFLKGQ